MADVTVKVNEGILRGKKCETKNRVSYFSFKGIPYAKPPVQELRFADSQPPERWIGVRDATKETNICPQLDVSSNTIIGNEDCLYLNVFTPKLPSAESKLLPVMVFLHGGCFVHGNGTKTSLHGPDYLIEKDVLIVTINYRLGILGFLNLDRKEAPGNMGLKDQVQALKWVKTNIEKFGGDPRNVTIFGISAGGASAEYLMLSPLAKGLFHKAIAQSGSSLIHWAHADNLKELAYKIPEINSKKIADKDELYKYLKDLPVTDLITMSLKALKATNASKNMKFGFVPSVENPGDWESFLDEQPYTLLIEGKFNKVPMIAGFDTREGLFMMSVCRKEFDKMVQNKDMVNYLPFNIDKDDKQKLENRLKSVYLEGKDYQRKDFAVDFFTDADFLGAVYVASMLISKHTAPVFFYEFAYDGRLNFVKKQRSIDEVGACHGDETGYLFLCDVLASEELADSDQLVKERMVTMWTNFAKYSDPTPKADNVLPIKWGNILEKGFQYLEISANLKMKENLLPARMKLYQELYEKYYK